MRRWTWGKLEKISTEIIEGGYLIVIHDACFNKTSCALIDKKDALALEEDLRKYIKMQNGIEGE